MLGLSPLNFIHGSGKLFKVSSPSQMLFSKKRTPAGKAPKYLANARVWTHKLVGPGTQMEDYDMIDEKQDVAIITPAESPEEPVVEPAADDCESCCRISLLTSIGN